VYTKITRELNKKQDLKNGAWFYSAGRGVCGVFQQQWAAPHQCQNKSCRWFRFAPLVYGVRLRRFLRFWSSVIIFVKLLLIILLWKITTHFSFKVANQKLVYPKVSNKISKRCIYRGKKNDWFNSMESRRKKLLNSSNSLDHISVNSLTYASTSFW